MSHPNKSNLNVQLYMCLNNQETRAKILLSCAALSYSHEWQHASDHPPWNWELTGAFVLPYDTATDKASSLGEPVCRVEPDSHYAQACKRLAEILLSERNASSESARLFETKLTGDSSERQPRLSISGVRPALRNEQSPGDLISEVKPGAKATSAREEQSISGRAAELAARVDLGKGKSVIDLK